MLLHYKSCNGFQCSLHTEKVVQVHYVYFHRRSRKDLMSSFLKGTAGIFMEPGN